MEDIDKRRITYRIYTFDMCVCTKLCKRCALFFNGKIVLGIYVIQYTERRQNDLIPWNNTSRNWNFTCKCRQFSTFSVEFQWSGFFFKIFGLNSETSEKRAVLLFKTLNSLNNWLSVFVSLFHSFLSSQDLLRKNNVSFDKK